MHKFTFDPIEHKYFVDGVELPSVTTILKPLQDFSMVPRDVLKRAAEFGTNVHKACELYDKGTLDESNLDADLAPYLNGWKLFLYATRFAPEIIERRVYSKRYKYAGTLDRAGSFPGKKYLDEIDIKTGVFSPAVGPQTAAYEKALLEMDEIKIKRRFVVLLRPNTFKMLQLSKKNNFNTFLSCLDIYNFNKNYR